MVKRRRSPSPETHLFEDHVIETTPYEEETDEEQQNEREDNYGPAPPPLIGRKVKKETRRFLKGMVASAAHTWTDSEDLGRLVALVVSQAQLGQRRSFKLISHACGHRFCAEFITSYYDAGAPPFTPSEIVALAERSGKGLTDPKHIRFVVSGLVEAGILQVTDPDSLAALGELGVECWTLEDQRLYVAALCEACDTKEECACVLAEFSWPMPLQQRIALAQYICRCDFFMDLEGPMEALFTKMPYLKDTLNPPAEDASEDSSGSPLSNFIVNDSDSVESENNSENDSDGEEGEGASSKGPGKKDKLSKGKPSKKKRLKLAKKRREAPSSEEFD